MLRKGFKRSLLFFLSYCADIYTELSVRSFYRSFYLPGGYKPETVSQYLSRMAKVGEIEKRVVKGKAVFVISAKGERMLNETIPLQKLGEKRWDGWWRIVIFDIEEKNRYLRDRVREKLIGLGFGKWQESVYISPHPVVEEMNEYFEEKDLYPSCICLEARKTGEADDKILAKQVFSLDNLTATYRELTEELNGSVKFYNEKKMNKSEAFEKLQSYLERFEIGLLSDPFLPNELWPEYKFRNKAQSTLGLFAQNIAKSV